MPERATRNWTLTYGSVVLIEALVVGALWLFSRYFSS